MNYIRATLLVLLFVSGTALAAPPDPNCRSDFDGDGVVTQDDIDQWTIPDPPPECDTNGNGQIDS